LFDQVKNPTVNVKYYKLFEDGSAGPIILDSELDLVCKNAVKKINSKIKSKERLFITMINPDVPVYSDANIIPIKLITYEIPQIQFFLETPPCCRTNCREMDYCGLDLIKHFVESKKMLLAIDLRTGLVYSIGSDNITSSEYMSLIRDGEIDPNEIERFIKDKFKESIIQKTLIYEKSLKYKDSFIQKMKNEKNGDYKFDYAPSTINDMGINKAKEIFDFDTENYNKFEMTDTTMIDALSNDYEAFDISVFNSKLINFRVPVGEQKADNDIILNSNYKLKLIQGKLDEISYDILNAAGYADEDIDYKNLEEDELNELLQFKRENIDYMFEKSLEELTTPDFSKYSIGLWLRYGTKEEIEEVVNLSGSERTKKKLKLSKKYKRSLPSEDIPYSQYIEYHNQQKEHALRIARQTVVTQSTSSVDDDDSGWETVSRRR
jgi:hypothetical protein